MGNKQNKLLDDQITELLSMSEFSDVLNINSFDITKKTKFLGHFDEKDNYINVDEYIKKFLIEINKETNISTIINNITKIESETISYSETYVNTKYYVYIFLSSLQKPIYGMKTFNEFIMKDIYKKYPSLIKQQYCVTDLKFYKNSIDFMKKTYAKILFKDVYSIDEKIISTLNAYNEDLKRYVYPNTSDIYTFGNGNLKENIFETNIISNNISKEFKKYIHNNISSKIMNCVPFFILNLGLFNHFIDETDKVQREGHHTVLLIRNVEGNIYLTYYEPHGRDCNTFSSKFDIIRILEVIRVELQLQFFKTHKVTYENLYEKLGIQSVINDNLGYCTAISYYWTYLNMYLISKRLSYKNFLFQSYYDRQILRNIDWDELEKYLFSKFNNKDDVFKIVIYWTYKKIMDYFLTNIPTYEEIKKMVIDSMNISKTEFINNSESKYFSTTVFNYLIENEFTNQSDIEIDPITGIRTKKFKSKYKQIQFFKQLASYNNEVLNTTFANYKQYVNEYNLIQYIKHDLSKFNKLQSIFEYGVDNSNRTNMRVIQYGQTQSSYNVLIKLDKDMNINEKDLFSEYTYLVKNRIVHEINNSINTLKKLCKERGIKKYSRLKKSELIQLLS